MGRLWYQVEGNAHGSCLAGERDRILPTGSTWKHASACNLEELQNVSQDTAWPTAWNLVEDTHFLQQTTKPVSLFHASPWKGGYQGGLTLSPSNSQLPPIVRSQMQLQVFPLGILRRPQLSSHLPILGVTLLALSPGLSAVNGGDLNDLTPIPAILRHLAFLSHGFLLSKSARRNWKLPSIPVFGNYICAPRV